MPILAMVLVAIFMVAGFQPVKAQEAPAQSAGPAYRINPGDQLEISVWGEERLQRKVRVLPDGSFAYPLVGQIQAAGRLPAEIERVITAGLQPQYRGPVPQVTVAVESPTGFSFSVIGKVRSPGTFTPGRYVNALEALSIAGGPTEFARIGDIRIIRKNGDRLVTVGVRISDILKGNTGGISPRDNPTLQSGDTLVVP